MKKVRFVKTYGLKENIRYYLLLPKYMLKGLVGILRKEHELNGMTIDDYFGLMKGLCDCKAGRMLKIEDI